MPKFLMKVNYSPSGIEGVLKEGGSARRDMATRTVESVGGRMEAFYYAFGDTDAFLIAELPDSPSAASVAMKVGAARGASIQTVVLMSPEEIDTAARLEVTYTPPGA